MERHKDNCARANKRGKISIFTSTIVIITVLLILGLLFLGFQYRFLLFPKPLTLSSSQDIKARFVIDAPEPYHVGDLLPVTFEIEARDGVTFQMPDLDFTGQNKIDLKNKSDIKKEKRRGGYSLSVHYLLTSWDVGKYDIPMGALSYQKSQGGKETYQVPSLNFEIVSLLPQNKSTEELLALPLKPAKKPMGLPPNYQYLWWFLIGAVIIVLIFILIKFFSKLWTKKTAQTVTDPLFIEPAHIIALRRLEALLKEKYPERGEYKTFYSELSECIREYMENRFQIRALEMTTEEFLDHLTRDACLKYEHQIILEKFLKSSDLVKFAKYIPSAAETDADFGMVRQLIEDTKETSIIPEEQTPSGAEELNNTNLPGEKQ